MVYPKAPYPVQAGCPIDPAPYRGFPAVRCFFVSISRTA